MCTVRQLFYFLNNALQLPKPPLDVCLAVPAPGKRGRARGPSFKLGGVAVNAKSVMACEKELEPLNEVLPADAAERSKWQLDAK
ncbi:hypothetical protein PR048_020645 [Dryococelus australis]|uniref:Uncharacterized protein n=1 Tax=Dryococelus australis TaxID=614101 RepID=A0ABQ9H6U6_9NEOP|nr:hypothetical protein PR048_020645 [Dryococelus australis]